MGISPQCANTSRCSHLPDYSCKKKISLSRFKRRSHASEWEDTRNIISTCLKGEKDFAFLWFRQGIFKDEFYLIQFSSVQTAFMSLNPFWHKFIPQAVHANASELPSVTAKLLWSPYPCSNSKIKMHLIWRTKLRKSMMAKKKKQINTMKPH